MMKILFSNPPWWQGRRRVSRDGKSLTVYRAGVRAGSRWPAVYDTLAAPDDFKPGFYIPYPYFMGYAATYAAKHTRARVTMRDSIGFRESYRSYGQHLDAERYDMIVFESATPSWAHDLGVIRQIKRKLPDTRIVVAGPIAAKSDMIMETGLVHACIKGEYEKGIVKVIEGATGVLDHDLLTREEMNAAPFPYYDAQIAHSYWDSNPRGQIWPQAQVWSSRGCPYKCIFCVWPATMTGDDPDGTGKRSVRHYSADYMEGFLTELVAKYDYKSIYFDDDTFNLGNAHVERMCAVMRKIDRPWSAMCRADTIRMETWDLMRESGCFGVKIGFESGNQWVVDNIVNKHLDLEYAREVVHHLKKIGMTVHGTFTYGLPGETRAHMSDTKRYIASLPFDTIQESGTAEIEGTPLALLREEGTLEKYAGARVDENYMVETDGRRKIDMLAERFRAETSGSGDAPAATHA
jgi:radical SAM superfamily enzyme YgiQ (UPF0313 family)